MNYKAKVHHLYHLIAIIDDKTKGILSTLKGILSEETLHCMNAILTDIRLNPKEINAIISQHTHRETFIDQLIFLIESTVYKSRAYYADYLYKFSEHVMPNDPHFQYFHTYFHNNLTIEDIRYPELFRYQNHINILTWQQTLKKDKSISPYSNPALLEYYIYHQINVLNAYLSESNIYNMSAELIVMELDKLQQLVAQYHIQSQEIRLLLKSLELVLYNRFEDFVALQDYLDSKDLKLHHLEIYSIYLQLINSLVINLKMWNQSQRKILEVYEHFCAHYPDIFYKMLNARTITNIALLSARCEEIDWFYKIFHKKNIPQLDNSCIQALTIANLRFLHHRRDYNACMEAIIQLKSADIFQELELRRLHIMCFYELGERVLVDNYLNTFKIFIYRNEEINKMYKESNNNFMRMLNKLNKSIDVKKVDSTAEEIQAVNRIAEKQWLLDKASELKQKLTSSHG